MTILRGNAQAQIGLMTEEQFLQSLDHDLLDALKESRNR